MSFVLIPFGRGTGKYWLKAFAIILPIFIVTFGYIFLAEEVNNGNITNTALVFVVKLFYPVWFILAWCLDFIVKWGILSMIPLIIIVVIFTYIWSCIPKKQK